MHLRSDKPYALLRHGLAHIYPSIRKDIKADVAIIGAGITGALIGWHLIQQGIQPVIVDRRHAGTGSTAASTSLLQYEIDTPLHKLIGLVGEKNAVLSYLLCRQAIYDLHEICKQLPAQPSFILRPSFQFASYNNHVKELEKEYFLRKRAGFNLQLLSNDDITRLFGFSKPGGLLSADGAITEAYELTHALLKHAQDKGAIVYDNTMVTQVEYEDHGVTLQTEWGSKITAKKLIIACGYESQQYLPKKIERLHSTYAIISEPFFAKEFWHENALIWETANPYLYIRASADQRILVGGKDDAFYNPNRRDANIARKTQQLESSFTRLFPQIPLRTDFAWAGTFASTKDGLPLIGTIPERPHTWFALGFGGNGITFSLIAAQIISDLLSGRKNGNSQLFQFDRKGAGVA
ncbi:FAD-dependent oxidoreductase [Paraflavitalea sp. CAU 1676]|uniref:NAD(P)/FAD-dependent oxidoreductase n=1 Tax=Paraflavitalea sp. CAU 1676 TaxID=3032598 RepID=UPI0023D97FA6|nr:FAD-dependent oxidoreductase [Paraflavitalea sp. CAU 1676]MDF2190293.1 FAD-dependent oxidoreductase [Paraflavitalea sp. CAU 1676]